MHIEFRGDDDCNWPGRQASITITGSEPPTPLIITEPGTGAAVFRLNRDGSVDIDWARIERIASGWTADETNQGVILCKALVGAAERVKAETESRFVQQSS